MSYFNFLESQQKFVKHVIERKLLWQSLVSGFAGFYSISFMRFLGRVLMKTMNSDEPVRMLVIDPLKTILLFAGSVVSVYLVSTLLGGRRSFSDYVISTGFIGLYFLCISFLMTTVSFCSRYMSETNNVQQWYVAAVILMVIIGIFFLVFTVKYGVVALSEVSGFGAFKAFFIWTLSFIPVLGVYIAWIRQ